MSKSSIYQLKISWNKKIHRIIAIKGNSSLYKLAEFIIHAYNFDFDHAFGFYNNIKKRYDSTEKYELFADDGYECSPGAKGVSKTYLCDVFEKEKTMLFMFDYGDGWEFIVECIDVLEPTPKIKYPHILEKEGRAPKQYR